MNAPLVLLPGLSCDRAAWQPVVDRLGDVACVVPVLPARDDLGAMAEDLLPALPETFALAGHSMGGRIALEILRRAPERVGRVALLDTGFRPLPAGEAGAAEIAQRHALLALAREQGMRAMGRRWSEPMVHAARRDDAALMGALLDMIARSDPDRFAREVAALIHRPAAADVLARIACPALVACGREDGWAPVAQHEELAARIAGSRLAVLADCGHMAPMERPDEVAAALRAWLAQSPRPGVRQAESRLSPA